MSSRRLMRRAAGAGLACFGALGLGLYGLSPAEAGCELVKATASESSPAEAARTSQGLVV
jgi:hypothetical protein